MKQAEQSISSGQQRLRVLVVLPMYGGSLPVGRYCISGLRDLGHLVEPFEAPQFHGAYNALRGLRVGTERLENLENGFLQLLSQAVLAKVETFEPDLVLALAQAPLTRQCLKRLSRDKVATAMWFVEDHSLFTYWRAFAPFYEYFAVIQKDPFLHELQSIGVENSFYLPLAADPGFHRPLNLSPIEQRTYGSDLSFLGAGYPNRRRLFRRFLQHDFKIWGSEWDDEILAPLVMRKGARIDPEEGVKIFNAAKINLNLHSSIKHTAEVVPGDFVNPRTFEIASCGGFQLVDRRELLAEHFAQDELAVFSSVSELEEMVAHYLASPEERAQIAARGRKRVLKEHTYTSRMQSLVDFIAKTRHNWPARDVQEGETAELTDSVPELREMIASLGLPADVGFDDLIWTLRQQQGELTEVEASLLFLDEWRKQYKK